MTSVTLIAKLLIRFILGPNPDPALENGGTGSGSDLKITFPQSTSTDKRSVYARFKTEKSRTPLAIIGLFYPRLYCKCNTNTLSICEKVQNPDPEPYYLEDLFIHFFRNGIKNLWPKIDKVWVK
jgi:hypothetical protein